MVMDVPAPHGEALGADVPDETLVKQRAEDTTGPEPAVGVLSERLRRPSICMGPQTRIWIYPRALFFEVPRRVAESLFHCGFAWLLLSGPLDRRCAAGRQERQA